MTMNRTHELIQKHLDGCASAAELAELDQLLSDSPEAAELFVRADRMQLLLEEHVRDARAWATLATAMTLPALGRPPSRWPWRWVVPAAAAAAVLLIAIGLTFLPRPGPAEMVPYGVVSGRVLVDGVEVQWIPDGSCVEVAGETAAVIRLADGGLAELGPQTAVVLHGRRGRALEMELDRGGGKFHVTRAGRPLHVDTPAGTITARDTEFSLELRPEDDNGGEPMNEKVALLLAVAVMAGDVEVRSKNQSYLLASGETGLFAPRKQGGGKIPMLTGRVTAVSADGTRLTVETPPPKPGAAPQQHEVRITGQTKLLYFGFEKDSDRPTVGYRVTAILDVDQPDTATRLEFGVKEPQVSGRVTAVAADGKALTLEVYRKGQPPASTEVRLTERTRLQYTGVDKDGQKPTVGYLARVWLKEGAADTATEIQFVVKSAKGKGTPDPTVLTGTIKAVSADGKVLTLEMPAKVKGGEPITVEIKVTERTQLAYFGVDKAGEKPTVGYVALVSLEPGSKDTASAIKLGLKGKAAPKPAEESKTKKNPESPKNKSAPEKKAAVTKPLPDTAKPRAQPPARDPMPLAAAIDREVDQRLAEAKAPPSPPADDAEFLRRVTLDITGRIPTSERTRAFLADTDSQKRRRLIDELLASPDYGRHFGTVWRNRIMPPEAGKGGKPPPADRFSPWLAEQFNQDRPWNEIVAELLTVEGDIARNPQSGFVMANSEGFRPQADRLAASVARLFLGVQLQCAQCHNHPFTGWTQADFWGTAAFFGRVRNTGKKGPPFILTEEPDLDPPATGKKGAAGAPPAAPGGAIVIPAAAGKGAGKVVKAKFLDGTEPALDEHRPYRPVFAAWLTAPTNPYFAPAAVNRLWAHFFGRGLVNPVDNFHPDNPPSHPALLKLLAAEFTASGGDFKHLVRGLCNSRAYQRTSRPVPGNEADSQLFSHVAVKVLGPEVLYDALTTAMSAGPAPGGKRALPSLGSRGQFVQLFSALGDAAETGEYGAGIPQLLKLMNAEEFNRSTPIVDRLVKTGASPAQAVEELYLASLCRRPTADEVRLMSEYVARRGDRQRAYAGVLWILLNSSEFALNH